MIKWYTHGNKKTFSFDSLIPCESVNVFSFFAIPSLVTAERLSAKPNEKKNSNTEVKETLAKTFRIFLFPAIS